MPTLTSATRTFGTLAAIVVLTTAPAFAQSAPREQRGWEVVVPSGWLFPTGDQQDALQRGGLTALQVTYRVRPPVALTSTFGWARSRDVASLDRPKLDVFMVDLGAEARGPVWFADHRVTLRPFGGVGAGMRSYNYRSISADAVHNVSAFANAGGEIGVSRIRLRLEARNYVSGFKPLIGDGATDARNDIALLAGLRWVRR